MERILKASQKTKAIFFRHHSFLPLYLAHYLTSIYRVCLWVNIYVKKKESIKNKDKQEGIPISILSAHAERSSKYSKFFLRSCCWCVEGKIFTRNAARERSSLMQVTLFVNNLWDENFMQERTDKKSDGKKPFFGVNNWAFRKTSSHRELSHR